MSIGPIATQNVKVAALVGVVPESAGGRLTRGELKSSAIAGGAVAGATALVLFAGLPRDVGTGPTIAKAAAFMGLSVLAGLVGLSALHNDS